MTYDRLDDEFQAAWKAGLVAERCERDLAGLRWLLLVGALAVAGLIALLDRSMPLPELRRRWVLLGAVGLTFLLAWATSRRMPVRSYLTALSVFIAACTFVLLVWAPPSSNRVQVYLWALLLPGMFLLGGLLTALKLRRARAQGSGALREAWAQVNLARRDPAHAVPCLERARDLLPHGCALAASIGRAIEAARSGTVTEEPGPPGPSSTAPSPDSPMNPGRLVSVGLFLVGAILVLTATGLGLPPAGSDLVAIGGFAVAVTGMARLVLRD